jgi:hypothetical protein
LRYFRHYHALALLAFLIAAKEVAAQAPKGESYRAFTDDGAWCWFSDPRALYYEGDRRQTYSGWVDSAGNIVVGSYNHENGAVERHVIHERLERDDHNNPSFLMDAQGKLMVFYSKHATGNSPIFLARAKNKEDISEWEPTQTLRLNDTIAYAGFSNTYTYTNIVRLSAEKNRLYLFWRGADFKPNFSVSDDNGRHWSEGRILVLPERIYRDRRPYMKIASNDKDVIHFAFTDGHPNAEPTNSIYYMRYHRGSLLNASGEKISSWGDTPVDPARADLVYDASTTGEKAWIWDVAETRDGRPVIVYARFPSDTTHVYWYSIFDAGRWNNYQLTNSGGWFPHTREGTREREPNYSGGIVLDHEDPSNVYLSVKRQAVFEIERWSTPDRGKTWKTTRLTAGSRYDNVRPFVVRNYPGDALKVLWMNIQEYKHYTDFRAAIRMSVIR